MPNLKGILSSINCNLFVLLTIAVILFYSDKIFAQDIPKVPVVEYKKNILDLLDMEINTKGNYKTNATSFDIKKLKVAPGSIYHFSRTQLDKMIVTSLLDLLEQVPSVSVVTSLDMTTSIAIRGMPLDNGNVSIYIDGVRTNDSFIGDISLLLQTPIDTLLEVLVVMSPSADINGSDSGLCSIWLKTSNLNKNSSELSVAGAGTLGGVSRMYVDFKNEKRLNSGLSFYIAGSLLANQLASINGKDIYGKSFLFQGMFKQESRRLNMGLKWSNWKLNFNSNIFEMSNYYTSTRMLNYHSAVKATYQKVLSEKIKNKSEIFVSLGTFTKTKILEEATNQSDNSQQTLVPTSEIKKNLDVNFNDVNFEKQYFANFSNVSAVVNSSINLNTRMYGDFSENFHWHLKGEAKGQFNAVRFTNKSSNTMVFGLTNKYERIINGWSFNMGIKTDFILFNKQYKILPSLNIHKEFKGWEFDLSYAHSYNMPTGFQLILLGDKFSINDNQFAHLKSFKEVEGKLSLAIDLFHHRNNYLPFTKTNTDAESSNIKSNFRATYGGEINLEFKQSEKFFARAWYSIHKNYVNDFEGMSEYFVDPMVSLGIPQNKYGASLSYRLFGYINISMLYKFEDKKQNIIFFDYLDQNQATVQGATPFNYQAGNYIDAEVKIKDLITKNLSIELLLKNILETNTFAFSTNFSDPTPLPKQGREMIIRINYRLTE